MNSFTQTWQTLGSAARAGLIFGCVCILAFATALAWWAYRPDYQVLFADLTARDAAAMAAELDKMKTPYQLADGGNTIMVPKDLVYKTRLSLMGKDVPLHGAVGFEVFNNADFGMTEFVQKVNYLRAIQGELTRTILSIEGIQAARVHLAVPEQGLFKKAVGKAKASVTVTMKPSHQLRPEQITGIQRLVAASVPDILPTDVTILDQNGVALSRPASVAASSEGAGESANAQLDSKRSTEDYLAKKVTQVLDRTFGQGEAIASVDVALNLDQSRITTEEILPAKRPADANPAGVVVRERYVSREGESSATASAKNSASVVNPSNTSSEFDYQVGRRVEQLSVASGTVKRMTVAVLVKQALNDTQMAQLKEVVSSAVGINVQRGDAVVVYSMDKFAPASGPVDVAKQTGMASNLAASNLAASGLTDAAKMSSTPQVDRAASAAIGRNNLITWLLAGILLAFGLLLLIVVFGRKKAEQPSNRPMASLDQAGREQLLAQIRQLTETGSRDAAVGKP